jgi:hypothetical protein
MAILGMTVDRREQGAGYVNPGTAPKPATGTGLRSAAQLPSRLQTSGNAS